MPWTRQRTGPLSAAGFGGRTERPPSDPFTVWVLHGGRNTPPPAEARFRPEAMHPGKATASGRQSSLERAFPKRKVAMSDAHHAPDDERAQTDELPADGGKEKPTEEGGLFSLLKDTATAFLKDDVIHWGASLAYYSLISLGPLVVLAMTIFGKAVGTGEAEDWILEQVHLLAGPTGMGWPGRCWKRLVAPIWALPAPSSPSPFSFSEPQPCSPIFRVL